MTASKKAFLKHRLEDLIQRLRELRADEVIIQEWSEPGRGKLLVLLKNLNEAIDQVIRYCETRYLDRLSVVVEFKDIEHRIKEFFHFILFLRMYRECLLPAYKRPLETLFSLVGDLYGTLPSSVGLDRDTPFILLPAGTFTAARFRDLLILVLPSGDYSNQPEGDQREIFFLECASNIRLDLSAVLCHEVMHTLLFRNEAKILPRLEKLQKKPAVISYFSMLDKTESILDQESHLIEHFCDYAAAWHYGNGYASAFVSEIDYYPKEMSASHPSAAMRIEVIWRGCRGKPNVLKAYRARSRQEVKRSGLGLSICDMAVKEMEKEFNSILVSRLSMKRYLGLKQPKSNMDCAMVRYLENNIPYTYSDVRHFFDALPEFEQMRRSLCPDGGAFSTEKLEKLNEFFEECVVRSQALRIFAKAANKVLNINLFFRPAFADEDGFFGNEDRGDEFAQEQVSQSQVAGVLSDEAIRARLGRDLLIHPMIDRSTQIAGCKVDLHLGCKFHEVKHSAIPFFDPLSASQQGYIRTLVLRPGESYVLHPGAFVLASVFENVALPRNLLGVLQGRSALARLGVVVHATAGFVDPNYKGMVVLELSNLGQLPIRLSPLLRVASIAFLAIQGNVKKAYGDTINADLLRKDMRLGQHDSTSFVPSQVQTDWQSEVLASIADPRDM